MVYCYGDGNDMEQDEAGFECGKTQFVGVAICDSNGQWSDDYFHILDIQESTKGAEQVLIVVLQSNHDSRCFAADASCIHGLRFNKYLRLGDSLSEDVVLIATDKTLRVS